MNWAADAAAGIKILASRHDSEDNNFAAGLSNALTKDGQSSPTADIPFNGKKITNLANPVNPQDAVTKSYSDGKVAKIGDSMSGALSITTPTGVSTGLTLTYNDDGAISGPWLYMNRYSASPAANDVIAAIGFRGNDSTLAIAEYAGVYTTIIDPLSTSKDGMLTLRTTVNNVQTPIINLTDEVDIVSGKLAVSVGSSLIYNARASNSALLFLNKPAHSLYSYIAGQTTGKNRWLVIMGNSTPESGSNTGSDFSITRCNDAGATLDNPMTIDRASGAVALSSTLNVTGASISCNVVYAGEASQGINGIANCCITNAGGAFFEGPNGAMAAGKIGGNGALMGIYQGTTACGSITVANASSTAYNTSSDIRIKTGVKGAENARSLVDALQVIEYEPVERMAELSEVEGVAPGPEVWIGISAQQAYAVYPTAVTPPTALIGRDYNPEAKPGEEGFVPWMIDYSKFVPMLMANVQDNNARMDALEARITALETPAP
jgi:hypothetical protein